MISGQCGATINLPEPTIINDIGVVMVSTNIGNAPGESVFFPVDTTEVIYEAFDTSSGQTARDTIIIIVNNTELPSFTTCPVGYHRECCFLVCQVRLLPIQLQQQLTSV